MPWLHPQHASTLLQLHPHAATRGHMYHMQPPRAPEQTQDAATTCAQSSSSAAPHPVLGAAVVPEREVGAAVAHCKVGLRKGHQLVLGHPGEEPLLGACAAHVTDGG